MSPTPIIRVYRPTYKPNYKRTLASKDLEALYFTYKRPGHFANYCLERLKHGIELKELVDSKELETDLEKDEA